LRAIFKTNIYNCFFFSLKKRKNNYSLLLFLSKEPFLKERFLLPFEH
jgi:hypothetical protein